MTHRNKNDEELRDALMQQHLELRKHQLEKAMTRAAAIGKEPFDLAKLESLCDIGGEGRLVPVDQRRALLEFEYYIVNAEITTIAQFASLIEESDK